MDQGIVTGSALDLPIPLDGIAEVLSGWNGKGDLWDALSASCNEPFSTRKWSPRDIERRASRVLFAALSDSVRALPVRLAEWRNWLPAVSVTEKAADTDLGGSVRWAATRREGWPPRRVIAVHRRRGASSLGVRVLKWTLLNVMDLARKAAAVEPTVTNGLEQHIAVFERLLATEPLVYVSELKPDKTDIRAIKSEGGLWHAVSRLADRLRIINDESLLDFACQLIKPSGDLRWRFFHLAVLGRLLLAAKSAGCDVISRRPLSAGSSGPAYEILTPANGTWDIWFEAASAFHYYTGAPGPHFALSRGLRNASRNLGADLLIIRHPDQAIVAECKYSSDADYIGRYGYQQTVCYAAEAMTSLAGAVLSWIVVPDGVLVEESHASTSAGPVGICAPSELANHVAGVVVGSSREY